MASEQDPNHELQLSDALAQIAHLDQALAETQANAIAVVRVMHAVSEAPTANATAKAALEAVLREFGWTYGSYWILDSESGVLRFAIDSGETNEAFRRVTMSSTFAEGVGFNGRTWKARDLVFVKDIGELSDCARAPVAKEMGIQSGVCFPILVGDDLVGTMDFFVNETLDLSASRMDALRNVARLVSGALARVKEAERAKRAAANSDAVNRVLSAVTNATTTDEAIRITLSVVRDAFGWAYGSYWTLDRDMAVLRFAVDSGEVNEAFRNVTTVATFAEGVGFSGRAWKSRDLVFVKDIGQLSDCSRAPVATAMGVRSGVCFPIFIGNELRGTMDFFVMETIDLEDERAEALRNVGRLVSANLTRLDALERERRNAIEFQATVTKLAKDLTNVSGGISAMTTTQTTISQNQATAIAQLSTTMTELRQMAIHTMDGAQSVIEVSQRALSGASEGRTAVDDAVRGMHEIRDKVREIGTKIATLSEQTKQIGEIIISVGEIAEQSRLLALNAAMEAARAGVHGRGFSVVAGEIRSLANQSKEATVQVRKILLEIKHATDATVLAMDNGVKNVDSGVALASRAGESIEALSRFVSEASEAARFIATSSRQQSAGVSQAAEAIGIINGDSTKVLEVVRQANEMVDSLETTVLDITALVSRLDGAEDTSRAGTA